MRSNLPRSSRRPLRTGEPDEPLIDNPDADIDEDLWVPPRRGPMKAQPGTSEHDWSPVALPNWSQRRVIALVICGALVWGLIIWLVS